MTTNGGDFACCGQARVIELQADIAQLAADLATALNDSSTTAALVARALADRARWEAAQVVSVALFEQHNETVQSALQSLDRAVNETTALKLQVRTFEVQGK